VGHSYAPHQEQTCKREARQARHALARSMAVEQDRCRRAKGAWLTAGRQNRLIFGYVPGVVALDRRLVQQAQVSAQPMKPHKMGRSRRVLSYSCPCCLLLRLFVHYCVQGGVRILATADQLLGASEWYNEPSVIMHPLFRACKGLEDGHLVTRMLKRVDAMGFTA
jgi:Zn-finger nucleic acid-binding protein